MNAKMQLARRGGFKGGKRLQGGWLAAAIGLATSLIGAFSSKKAAKDQNKLAEKGIEAADPYAPYRKEAAERLRALMNDPSSITDTADYKMRMQGAERTMAAQGYTGSGNALYAAAEASQGAYDSAFSKLATLSGAGATPGAGYGNALQTAQNGSDTYLSSLAGVANNATNFASMFNAPKNSAASPTVNPAMTSAFNAGAYVPPANQSFPN